MMAGRATESVQHRQMEERLRTLLCAIALSAAAVAAAGPAPPVHFTPDHAVSYVESAYEIDDRRVEEARERLGFQDVTHCAIDVCLNPALSRVSCETHLRVVSRADSVRLVLDPSFTVASVLDGGGRTLEHTRSGSSLSIRAGAASDTFSIVILQSGSVDRSDEHVWRSPDFMYLSGAGSWYPRSPTRDLSTYEMIVRCPPGFSTVCTGALAGMAPERAGADEGCLFGDRWSVSTPVPFVDVVVGRLDTSVSVWRDVFLAASWHVPASGETPNVRPAPSNPTSAAKTAVRFLEACFGPYPYDWLSVVSAPRDAAGGRTCASGPGVIVVADLDTRARASLLPDPDDYISGLAANWWLFSTDAGRLVSEGLGAQAEIMWVEATRDEGEAVRRRELLRMQYAHALADSGRAQPLSGCLGETPTGDDRVCRGKGSAVFSVLDRIVGHELYCRTVRRLSEEHAGGELAFRDFMAAFEEALGAPLDWFVFEWICRSGLPTYRLEYDTSPSEDGFVVRGVIEQEGEVYRTPLPLTIDLGGWAYEEWVAVDSADQSFEIETQMAPLEIVIDASRRIPVMDRSLRAEMHYERGARAAVRNEWGLAVDEFGEAALVEPDRAEYRYSYGEALVRSGRLAEGLDSLEAAVELDPENPDYRLWLAHLYLGAGNHGAALVHLDAYIELRPGDAAAHADRVLALVGLKRTEEARKGVLQTRRMLDAGGQPASALEKFHLASGWYHEAVGDTAAAIADYRSALDVNPVSDEARGRLSVLDRSLRSP